MNLKQIAGPVAAVILVAAAWENWGWRGVALAVTGIVMWLLIHFSRALRVLRVAAVRPVGSCENAVMLNARLKTNVSLLQVMGLTRSIGEQLSAQGAQPEVFRWTDGGGSSITCDFVDGRLAKWSLLRPQTPDEAGPAAAP